jgi:hypothetical protein
MATTKKAGKRRRMNLRASINLVPLCIQIEHSAGNLRHLKLSRTGTKFPIAVYWMLQSSQVPKNSNILLPLGYFQGYPGSPTTNFLLPIDANTGITNPLMLTSNAPMARFDWDYVHSVRGRLKNRSGGKVGIHSGGGIIVDA